MFIEKMSSEELLNEYNLDLPEIQAKTLRFDGSEYVSNYLWKHRKESKVVITKVFNTKRGNRYLGIIPYHQEGVGQEKCWNRSSFHIGLMQTSKGLSAIAFYEGHKQAIKFTSHFFRRYKQRMMNICDICDWKLRNQLNRATTVEEVIPIYVKRNIGITWIETNSVFRDKVHIFAPVNDGVVLLQWDKSKKLLQANTFVTLDMLDDKQLEMVGYAQTYFSMTEEERKQYKFPDFISGDESSEINN